MGEDTKENIEILKQLIEQYKPIQTSKTREELYKEFDDKWETLVPLLPENMKNKKNFSNEVINKKFTTRLTKEEIFMLVNRMNEIIKNSGGGGGEGEPPISIPIPIPQQGKGIKGKGIVKITLARKHPSQVLDTDIDYSLGIIKAPKFIPIGKHLINKHRLDDNIVAIKRQAGSGIPSLPSQRVSNNVAEVLKKLLSNKAPTYDDLNELNNDDKLILDKIAKETQIKDRLQLPKPIKAEQDKDVNQFEVLKGEILAGNDNPDIVKKFKRIILKLSHQNLLPKGQAKELLMDLINLGH